MYHFVEAEHLQLDTLMSLSMFGYGCSQMLRKL